MDSFEMIRFFGGIKQEASDIDDDVANIIEQEYYCKQEPDDEWDNQQLILDDVKERYTFLSEPAIHVFQAKVFVERLPESIIKQYVTVERKPKIHQSTVIPPRVKKRPYVDRYQKLCPKCRKVIPFRTTSVKKCGKCSVKYVLECNQCKKQILDFPSMKKHLIVKCNAGGHFYRCRICPHYFSLVKRDVSIHVSRRHPSHDPGDSIKKIFINDGKKNRKKYNCSACGKYFSQARAFLRHTLTCGAAVKQNATNTDLWRMFTYSCVNCKCTVTKIDSTNECAIQKCTKCGSELFYNCIKCLKMFSNYVGLSAHCRITHGSEYQNTYQCPACDKSMDKIKTLIMHYENRHKYGVQTCEKCGKSFKTKTGFTSHILRCGPAAPQFHCDHCSYVTKYKMCLAEHLENKHIVRNSIDCSHCGGKYKNKKSFNDHLRYCGKETYLSCDKCKYTTRFKSALVRHKYSMHPDKTKSKDFPCSLCGKTFHYDSARKAHEYSHRKNRRSCNYCYYKTLSKLNIERHFKTMHLVKKFEQNKECPKCGTIIKNEHFMKLHLKRYCPAKPYYECDHCIYATWNKKQLVAHISWMHSKDDYHQAMNNIDIQIDVTN